jgi:ATP adenylyltransferase
MKYFFNFEKMKYLKGKKPSGCALCLIRDKSPQVPDLTVFRNEFVEVSLNLYPYNPGHLMVFPLRHMTDIRNLEKEERAAMDQTVDKALDVVDSVYSPQGYNIGFNMGRAAGASIEHIHLHIIPRYAGEIGIAELLAGKRVMVEDLFASRDKLREAWLKDPRFCAGPT